MCLRGSRNPELEQRVAEFRRGLLAEVRNLVAECVAESLAEIDQVLEECLAVPQLRSSSVAGIRSPVPIAESVRTARESLRHRVVSALKEDREIMRAEAQRAQRKRQPTQATLDKPVVSVAWKGELPELRSERRLTV